MEVMAYPLPKIPGFNGAFRRRHPTPSKIKVFSKNESFYQPNGKGAGRSATNTSLLLLYNTYRV
jgi:hypothetical protein